MRSGIVFAFVCLACSKPEAPAPKPVPSVIAALPVASVPVDPLFTVSSLTFVGDQLHHCEEITGAASKWATQLPQLRADIAKDNRPGIKEILAENKTCAEAIGGGRVEQATCEQPPHYVARYYGKALVDDSEMKKCLAGGGTWKANQSAAAALDRLR